MRCMTIEELAVVSGGGDPNGCKSDIAAGAGIGAVVGTAVGGTIGAVVGTVAGPGGTGMGMAYGGAIGGEIGLLGGGAVAAAYSPACSTSSAADSFLLNADQSSGESDAFVDPWSGISYHGGSGPWDYDPDWMM